MVGIVNAISAAVQRSIQFFHLPVSPTGRFNGGFNTGVSGGYEWGPWRFEEEYSYRQNGARDVVGSNFTVNAAGGDRHSNSIMTNVLYDFTPGYPITPHVGFGVGAADVFDGLKLPGIGQVLNGNSWQFGYQGIAGIRYHLSGARGYSSRSGTIR